MNRRISDPGVYPERSEGYGGVEGCGGSNGLTVPYSIVGILF